MKENRQLLNEILEDMRLKKVYVMVASVAMN